MNQTQRPLSPHLQIYRLQITSVLSILHRLTGFFLASGPVVLVVWLALLVGGKESYEAAQPFFCAPLSQLYFFALNYCFFYHLCNGVRHLAWDGGYGFELKTVHKTGWIVIVLSLLLSLGTWFWI